jgi:hypothetical protein
VLLDSLAGPDDRLWPHERWPPMRLDGGLAAGAHGGHGPVRYSVEAYEPGRLARFRFSAPRGLEGEHRLEVDGDLLRHVVEARTSGPMRFGWPLFFRPLHDALVEDALDKAQGLSPRPFGVRVRALRAIGKRLR